MKRLFLLTCGCLILVSLATFSPKVARASGAVIVDLPGVAALSDDNVWVVGQFESPTTTAFQALIEHWNGSTWQIVPSPVLSPTQPYGLNGIAAVSKNNIWAVGSYSVFGVGGLTLIEHWNGSTWQVVPSPNAPGDFNILQGVAVVSKNDAWAVGETSSSFGTIVQTLIEHWDGHTWRIVTSPNLGPQLNFLNGVAAISKINVWAVGDYYDASNTEHGLIEHWNGHTWRVVTNTDLGQLTGSLQAVAASSAHDVWAVGGNIVEHWNGHSWKTALLPSNALLSSVAAVSRKDVWAVGSINGGTLTEHWNGHVWSIVPSPSVNTAPTSFLMGVGAVLHDRDDVWAAGGAGGENGEVTLIERWNGHAWSIVPSANP